MSGLKVSGLRVHYGTVEAVRDVSFEVGQGEIVALLGANGAGKSSTLNAMVGLVPVLSGQIHYDGEDIRTVPTEFRVQRGIALVPEGRRVFAGLSVLENLRLGAYSRRGGRAARIDAYEQTFALFPILRERQQQLAGTLSGGQQQMLAIARALMSQPRLLLLDEPSLGLAPQIVETIFELISTLREQGITILLVEQNVAMSLDIVNRAYLMASGQIVATGTAEELKSSNIIEQSYLGTH